MANDESNPWQDAADPNFDETTRTQAELDHRRGYDDQGNKKRSPWGCLLYGCLTIVLLGIIAMVIAGVAGYYFVKGQVEQYTDDTPVAIASVEMSDEEIAALESRVEAFQQMVDPNASIDDGPTDEDAEEGSEENEAEAPAAPASMELVLTADDINALIAKDPNLKGHIFIRIEDGSISGDVSMPTDFLRFVGKGRYFNASATFDVSLDPAKNRGMLEVHLVDAEVKGQSLPQQFLDTVAGENFAKDAYDNPEVAQVLDRFESLRIEGDRIILKVRPLTAEEIAEKKAEIEIDAMPVPLNENAESTTEP